MIDNCGDCKTKCCRAGPGPYKKMPPEMFLANYGEFENYNVQCEAFVDEKCSLWGTPEMPLECRIFVCPTKTYTDLELNKIAKLTGRVE